MGLSDTLVERGVISDADLAQATARQREAGTPLGRTLIDLGLATEKDIVGAVAASLDLEFADLAPGMVDPEAAAMLPRSVAREVQALPVRFDGGNALVVAVTDPSAERALERVRAETGLACSPALAVRRELLEAIEALADPGPAGTASPTPGGGNGQPDPHAPSPVVEAVDEPQGAARLLAYEEDTEIDLHEVLGKLIELGGSDLHLTAGLPPMVRLHGEVERLEGYPKLMPAELQKLIYSILTQKQREAFETNLEFDLSYAVPDVSRFRVNVFQQRGSMGAVIRAIPFDIVPLENLGMPPQIANFAHLPRGFVLVTGPTGSGKSTTLASLIDIVNRQRSCHIMTVEDPIEFLHRHRKSIVNQREIGSDTLSFAAALKHALRQDPDVILVGEMRDLETIQVALTAAETGHLVFGTLHTQDAPQTVDRLIDVFPPHQQEQIRVMLGGALQGVVCQTLLKTPDGQGRVAATEVMMATSAIKNLIREGKTHQMYSSIQAGKQHGMITMDQSLADLVKAGKVTYDAALEKCNHVADFNRLAGRA